MKKVVGVKFKENGKLYYFSPGNTELKKGDNVIVETSRGLEFGKVTMQENEVPAAKIVAPLKEIVRKATEKDCEKHQENLDKRGEALRLCKEKIDEHNLKMKLVDAEYTFDNSKVVFYFTADGRVDFRELVKDLAAVFRRRIELRQIGVRDEAKMLGGVGNCGRGLCCGSWLYNFRPVSIKMAKLQNLSLNPTKISGMCGRLMCCLKFENDVYAHLKKGMPSVGDRVKTPDGIALVTDVNILESLVRTRLILEEDDKKNDVEEKLSTEFYSYSKDEVKKIAGKSGRSGKRSGGKKTEHNTSEEENREDAKEATKG